MIPGLKKIFKQEYATWPDEIKWDGIVIKPRVTDLIDLPEDMSYEEIADIREAGQLNQFVTDPPNTMIFDYDTKLWTAQYGNAPDDDAPRVLSYRFTPEYTHGT